jgi:Holliday junction resolvase
MSYSWRDFGMEAEFVVASYLKSKGWNIRFSPSSRGAADLVASKDDDTWCIQVKASLKSPHIRSDEIGRLKKYAIAKNGLPVLATVQPWENDTIYGFSITPYMIILYSMNDWTLLGV